MLAQGLLDVSFIVPVLICAAGAAGLSYLLDREVVKLPKTGLSHMLFARQPARSSSPSASSVLRTLWKLPACAPRTSQMHLEPESYPL